jgi:general secretion pathway protein G
VVRTIRKKQGGFSLLELMIAMFILIILLSIALPTYNRSVQHARETVLKENLWQMRRAIDQYNTDKGRLPESIENLVEAQYLREMPIDPITDKPEWDEIMGEDPMSAEAQEGLKNVKSLADGKDMDGKDFKDY